MSCERQLEVLTPLSPVGRVNEGIRERVDGLVQVPFMLARVAVEYRQDGLFVPLVLSICLGMEISDVSITYHH